MVKGVICYVLLSGSSPFKRDADFETQNAIIKGEFDFSDHSWSLQSDAAMNFIERILRNRPEDRPTLNELLNHDWLEPEMRIPRVSQHSPQHHSAQKDRRLSKRSSSQMLITNRTSETGSDLCEGSDDANSNLEDSLNPTKRAKNHL